jgi:hypothetical protein
MVTVASQLIEEVTAHARRDSLKDAREMCADGTYFPNNLRTNSDLLERVLLLLLFCRARWLMPPDVPQPVRLIVLTLL